MLILFCLGAVRNKYLFTICQNIRDSIEKGTTYTIYRVLKALSSSQLWQEWHCNLYLNVASKDFHITAHLKFSRYGFAQSIFSVGFYVASKCKFSKSI